MGECVVEVMVVVDDDVVVDPDVLVTVVDDALFRLLLLPGLSGSDEVELLKTDWPLRSGVDMGEVEGVAMLLLVLLLVLLMKERGWDGLERWFLSKGLLPVLLCEYVIERVACKEGAKEEWNIAWEAVVDVVAVVVVVVTVEDGTLVFFKAVSLSMLSRVVWKLFKVFVVVPTVMQFCSWSWTNTRSGSGVGGKGVEALEVRIANGGWLSKMEGTTCSCCCKSFLSKVSNNVESCAFVWKGAGMCTGAICEEELGRGRNEDDDDDRVLICLGTGLACASS